jgi:general stress protein 26
MAQTQLTDADAVREFWDHSQPMTAFTEPADQLIWFFSRNDTDFAAQVAAGAEGRLIFMSKDQEVYADVIGQLSLAHDKDRIARYWNPMVAAWYPDGQDDSHLTLIRFIPNRGQIWVSKQGLLSLAFQVAKANITKTMPDVGGNAEVVFRD